MSYSVEEIKKATKECRPLKSRVGAIINAKQLATNPNCGIPPTSNNKMAWIIGGIAVAGIVYFMFIKK